MRGYQFVGPKKVSLLKCGLSWAPEKASWLIPQEAAKSFEKGYEASYLDFQGEMKKVEGFVKTSSGFVIVYKCSGHDCILRCTPFALTQQEFKDLSVLMRHYETFLAHLGISPVFHDDNHVSYRMWPQQSVADYLIEEKALSWGTELTEKAHLKDIIESHSRLLKLYVEGKEVYES